MEFEVWRGGAGLRGDHKALAERARLMCMRGIYTILIGELFKNMR